VSGAGEHKVKKCSCDICAAVVSKAERVDGRTFGKSNELVACPKCVKWTDQPDVIHTLDTLSRLEGKKPAAFKIAIAARDEWLENVASDKRPDFDQEEVVETNYVRFEFDTPALFVPKDNFTKANDGWTPEALHVEMVKGKTKQCTEALGVLMLPPDGEQKEIPLHVFNGTLLEKKTPLLRAERHLYKDQANEVYEHHRNLKTLHLGQTKHTKYPTKNVKAVKIYSREEIKAAMATALAKKGPPRRSALSTLGGAGPEDDDGSDDSSVGKSGEDDDDAATQLGDAEIAESGEVPAPRERGSTAVAASASSPVPNSAVSPGGIRSSPVPIADVAAGSGTQPSLRRSPTVRNLSLPPPSLAGSSLEPEDTKARTKSPAHWLHTLRSEVAFTKASMKLQLGWAEDCVKRIEPQDPVKVVPIGCRCIGQQCGFRKMDADSTARPLIHDGYVTNAFGIDQPTVLFLISICIQRLGVDIKCKDQTCLLESVGVLCNPHTD